MKHPRRAYAFTWAEEGGPVLGVVVVLARVEQVARAEACRLLPRAYHDRLVLDGEVAVPATGAVVVYFQDDLIPWEGESAR